MKEIILKLDDLKKSEYQVYTVPYKDKEWYGYYDKTCYSLQDADEVFDNLNSKVNLDVLDLEIVLTPISLTRVTDGRIEPMSRYLGRQYDNVVLMGAGSSVDLLEEVLIHEIGHALGKYIFKGSSLEKFKLISGYPNEDYRDGWGNSVHEVLAEMFKKFIINKVDERVKFDDTSYKYYLSKLQPLIRKEGDNMDYKDIKGEEWYAPYVKTVTNAGYMEGFEDGTFRPDEALTRSQAAKLICELKGLQVEKK